MKKSSIGFALKTILFIGFIVSLFVKNGFSLESTRGIIHFILAVLFIIYYLLEVRRLLIVKTKSE